MGMGMGMGIWIGGNRTEPASGGQVSTTPFFRLCPQDHIFKRRGVTECQIKAKGVHHAMLQGIGCSRLFSMVSQSQILPLILTTKEAMAKPEE